MNTVA